MTFSKITLTLALVLSLSTIVNCGKKDDHFTDPASDATFFVDKGGITLFNTNVIVTRDAQQKPNQKDFKVQACIKDKALQSVVQELPFKVIADGNEIVKTTDVTGCIIWDEQIRYDALSNEAELLVVRKIQALKGHAGSISIELALNPWATEDGMKVTDLRYDGALRAKSTSDAVTYNMVQFQSSGGPQISAFSMEVNVGQVNAAIASNGRTSKKAPETRMRLDSIQMQFLGHDYSAYEMTPTLTLKVAHKYRIRISPLFIRENFNGKQIFETIASGQIKFHMAIFRDTIKPKDGVKYFLNEVLATSEFTGEMVDGFMVADVTLKFQDLAPLTGRTILLLGSSPVPGYINFRDGNYMSPVGPLVAASSISFIPSNWNAEVVHQNHLKYVGEATARSKVQTNFDFFKTRTGFVELPKVIDTIGAVRGVNQSANHQQEMITALQKDDHDLSQATKNAICAFLTQEKSKGLKLCDGKFVDEINFRQREIVEEITQTVPEREGITVNEDLAINMNYTLSNDDTKGKGQNARGGINAGLNGALTAGLNAGLDLDMLNTLKGGKLPGFKWLAWLSKVTGNIPPEVKPVDVQDPHGPVLPADPKPLDPKQGLGAKLGANISANLGGMAQYNNDLFTWTYTDTRKQTGSISTSVKFNATAEMKVFSFKGKFKKCWLANLSTPLKSQLEKRFGKEFSQLGMPKGVYTCLPQIVEGERKEMFVLVNSVTGIANSPLTDSLDSREAPLRMYFRGPMGYSVFKNLLMERKMELKFNKFPLDKLIGEVRSLKNEGDMYLNQEFPGVLNNVLE